MANLDTRNMIGRIYVGYHLLLLHTKYKSSGSHGLREEDFLFIFLLYDSRGMIGRIYVDYHLTLLHTKYTSFRPCGLGEEDF